MRTAAGNLTQGVVAVTGGTGFIGSHLVTRLLQQGCRLRLLVRPRRDGYRLSAVGYRLSAVGNRQSPVGSHCTPTRSTGHRQETTDSRQPIADSQIIMGDLRDAAAVTRLLDGADVAFHLAAYARPWAANQNDFETINVDGTRNVAAAARACHVRRLVHVSTELVDGDETAYQRTKRAAEQIVQDYAAAGGDAVIARPTRVYGPGPLNPANSVTRIIALYRRGLFRVRIADGGVRANYVYVEDVVDGLMRCAGRGAPGAEYVLGGEDLTIPQLLELVADATGRSRAAVAAPRSLVKGVAGLCELGGRLGVEPLITRDWVDLLTQDRPMSSAKAQAELGYRPRGAREGIAATVAWLNGVSGAR